MTLLHETAYVYEVYRQRSFTRAAQALYISQPSLSQMIRKAEGRIGTTIFDRSTSPIGLTEAGRAYIRAAEQVLQIESDLCIRDRICAGIWMTRKGASRAY